MMSCSPLAIEVPPKGIKPLSAEPESAILFVELQGRNLTLYTAKLRSQKIMKKLKNERMKNEGM